MNQIKFPKFKNYTNQKVNFIQPKLDGHLTKIYTATPRLIALTKNDKDITEKLLAINHIKKELNGLPRNSIIFAELHCPGVHATSVPTMLNEADEELMLTAFAAPLLGGEDWRDQDLCVTMQHIKNNFELHIATPTKWDSSIIINHHDQKELLKEAIERKLEGWVLKEAHMKGWYKLKPVKTLDVFVIGTYQSFSSTHYGGLQSIEIAVWELSPNYPVLPKRYNLGNVGSGFKLEYRKQFNTNVKRTELLNKVCEVAYDSIAANGKLRFPRFIRWRDDKDSRQCTTEQLEN